MLRAPSLQSEYTLVFSGDPALSLPEDETERENALRVARETGQWQRLCHSNQLPTVFKLRPLPHSAYEWMIGESARRRLTHGELATLAVRLALRGIDNLEGAVDFETVVEAGQVLAATVVTDALAKLNDDPTLGFAILAEIGTEVMRRAREIIPPKR